MNKNKRWLAILVTVFVMLLNSIMVCAASDLDKLDVRETWTYGTGANVNVAVIDYGFNLDDTAIKTHVKGVYYAKEHEENWAKVNTGESHGTSCTKILLTVAPNVNLYMIKVTTEAQTADAINWAVAKGCRVISKSNGSTKYNASVEKAIDLAYTKNVMFFGSAGNTGAVEMHFPASYEHSISVCAATGSTPDNYKARTNATRNAFNDLAAPGTSTSKATPFAAGVAALLIDARPSLTATEIERILLTTAMDLETPGWDEISGFGLIQPFAAMQQVDLMNRQVDLTFQANGGSVNLAQKTVLKNEAYGVLPIATRTNYTFKGWYTSANGGSRVTDTTIVAATNYQTIYAQWQAYPKYTVKFSANGGKVKTSQKSVIAKNKYGTLPIPTRSGYNFTGWYTSKNGGSKITSVTMMTASKTHTLYAHWQKYKKYTVKFNAAGGKVSRSKKTVTEKYKYGSLPTPKRKGYTFKGWYTARSGGKRVTSSTVVAITKTQTLYAHWKKK